MDMVSDCAAALVVPPTASRELEDAERARALATAIVQGFSRADLAARAAMIGRLLAAVGPLALAVVANGAFARYVPYARWACVPVSHGDAAIVTPRMIAELVQYVQQSNPELFERLPLWDLPHANLAEPASALGGAHRKTAPDPLSTAAAGD
jgi:hypothetical protein